MALRGRAPASPRSRSPTTTRSRRSRPRAHAAGDRARAGARASSCPPRSTGSSSTSSATTSIPTHEALRERLDAFRQRAPEARACDGRAARRARRRDRSPTRSWRAPGPGVVGRPHVARGAGARGPRRERRRRVPPLPRPERPRVHAAPRVPSRGSDRADPRRGRRQRARAPGRRCSRTASSSSCVDVGLRGIEVWHPQHGSATVRRYRALAARLGLLETGGSDFHGPRPRRRSRRDPVPASVLARLKEAAGVSG